MRTINLLETNHVQCTINFDYNNQVYIIAWVQLLILTLIGINPFAIYCVGKFASFIKRVNKANGVCQIKKPICTQ